MRVLVSAAPNDLLTLPIENTNGCPRKDGELRYSCRGKALHPLSIPVDKSPIIGKNRNRNIKENYLLIKELFYRQFFYVLCI